MSALAENLVPVAWMSLVWYAFGWEIAVFGVLLPAIGGVTLLGLFFDFFVHTPYQASVAQRYRNTRAYVFHGGLERIGPVFWSGQNYHLLHHLYPWVPFYRYGQAYRAAQKLLEIKQSPIIHIGSK